ARGNRFIRQAREVDGRPRREVAEGMERTNAVPLVGRVGQTMHQMQNVGQGSDFGRSRLPDGTLVCDAIVPAWQVGPTGAQAPKILQISGVETIANNHGEPTWLWRSSRMPGRLPFAKRVALPAISIATKGGTAGKPSSCCPGTCNT